MHQQPDKHETPTSRSMGEHGGNRGETREADKTQRDGRPASRQSHGADPHRGEPAREAASE